MSTEVKVPVLPESVSDATIAAWHKKVGDPVRRDENLLDLWRFPRRWMASCASCASRLAPP